MARIYPSNFEEQHQGDAVSAIPNNRTLLVTKCTGTASKSPQIAKGLKNIQEVFAHYAPENTVSLETTTRGTKKETFRYHSLNDFEKKSLHKKSAVLRELQDEKNHYLEIAKQLNKNKQLQEIITSPDAKKQLLDTIKSLKKVLKNLD